MADSIGQAYVQILPTTKGFSSKLSSELGGGGAGGALMGAGKKMGGKLAIGLAAGAAAAGLGKIVAKSIGEGKELEQNLGGTEAVFGKFADNLQKKSAKAYKNMGMSASDYMATANKMGSLFQGSGVKQEQALKMTTDAMQRAADVASVMGIDTATAMESIAGAAKGNFTMMDNLGVAMNATTLEAYALEKGMNFEWKTASNAEKSELAMKMFMDRTSQYQNNFAKESESTLSGSLGAIKALSQDILGNLAIGADITPQLNDLLNTVQTFLIDNLLPMVSNVLTGLANNAGQLGSILSTLILNIGQQIITLAPTLLQAGLTLLLELGKGLVQGLPQMIPMITQVVVELVKTLTEPSNLTMLILTGLSLIIALAEGLADAVPVLISVLPDLITNVVNTLIKLAPKLLPVAIKLVATLAIGLISQIGALAAASFKLITSLINTFKKTDWKKIGKDIIEGIKKGLSDAKEKLLSKIREIASLLPDAVKKLLKIGSPSKVFADEVGRWIPAGIALGITQNAGMIDDAMDGMFRNPMLTSGGMSMNITARDNTSAFTYAGVYDAIKEGASQARPVVILNNRVLSRELKGMGVSFA